MTLGADFLPRLLSALVLGPAALAVAWFGGWPFLAFWTIAALLVLWEWACMTGLRPHLPVLLLGVSTLAACEQMQATANRADGKPKTAKTETKSDDTRILTCFLEYFPGYAVVNDLLHEKRNGAWVQKVSAYRKLRISEEEMRRMLAEGGFDVIGSQTVSRMIYLTAVNALN
mgnify:CR=1 FL=1